MAVFKVTAICLRERSTKINDYIRASEIPVIIISSTVFICVQRLLESADILKTNLKLLKPFHILT